MKWMKFWRSVNKSRFAEAWSAGSDWIGGPWTGRFPKKSYKLKKSRPPKSAAST